MKTKEQKKSRLNWEKRNSPKSETVVITDFNGLTANNMNAFRKAVRGLSDVVMVIKKKTSEACFCR